MLQDAKNSDYFKRLYYVGMTRAKHNLYFISNRNYFHLENRDIIVQNDATQYKESNLITLLMSLKNINLGFESNVEQQNMTILAGSKATLIERFKNKPRLLMMNNLSIAQLSKSFEERLSQYEQVGYNIIDIEIESVIHWIDKNVKIDKEHPLCKIVLKMNS